MPRLLLLLLPLLLLPLVMLLPPSPALVSAILLLLLLLLPLAPAHPLLLQLPGFACSPVEPRVRPQHISQPLG